MVRQMPDPVSTVAVTDDRFAAVARAYHLGKIRMEGQAMDLPGFLKEAKRDVQGGLYRGRMTLPGVQWTGVGSDAFATFTITADQLADAAESRLLWTDQAVQRGVNPSAPRGAPRELALADGYPDKRSYIFDAANADDIVEKLLRGERLFLNSLVWNLRPRDFSAYWSTEEESIYFYAGKVFLPDSHHRHQAILKAVRAIRESPASYPKFSGDHQFKVELYFLDKEGEGNYFFDKNQRPKPTAKSKAYDLTTLDDLSLLAKRVIEKSPSLSKGVNRVTDRLSKKSPEYITLSTLREMMKTFAGTDEINEAELEGLALVAAEFFEMLSAVRPELRAGAVNSSPDSIAAAAVMMHGYAALMKDYGVDIGKLGPSSAKERWRLKLSLLSQDAQVSIGDWTGDLLSKRNPLWLRYGMVKLSGTGGTLNVLNTGGARAQAGRLLRRYLKLEDPARTAELMESSNADAS